MESDLVSPENEIGVAVERSNDRRPFSRVIAISGIVIASLVVGYGTSHLVDRNQLAKQSAQLRSIGKVGMSATELITTAKLSKTTIYWAGSVSGYTYSLSTDSSGSSVVRYLPTAGAINTSINTTRMVATYVAAGAYDKSITVSKKIGNSSFKNADGSLVFYKTDNTNDIFMAFPGKNVQVEIFDPVAGQALSLSVLAGEIRPIA